MNNQVDPNNEWKMPQGSINMPGQSSTPTNEDNTLRDFILGAAVGSGTTLLGYYLANKNSEQRRKNKTHTKQKPSSFAI